MSSDLPIDWEDPRVKDYLSLIRLQVLTPLSLLINIFITSICALVVSPSMSQIERLYPTPLSPRPIFIGIYILAIWVTQIGYCVLLLIARKEETKASLIKGVGLSLVFVNWITAGWAVAWVFKQFLVAAILSGLVLLLLIYSNINLLVYHTPTWSRPVDIALIHTPLRFFLVLPFQIIFPVSLFITLGLTFEPTSDGPPKDYHQHAWPGFAVLFGTNIVALIVVVLRKDLIWCIASAWLSASIWARKYVPPPVYAVAILFTFLHPVALAVVTVWQWGSKQRKKQRRGPVALEGDDTDHPGLSHHGERGEVHHQEPPRSNETSNNQQGPREVDASAVWG